MEPDTEEQAPGGEVEETVARPRQNSVESTEEGWSDSVSRPSSRGEDEPHIEGQDLNLGEVADVVRQLHIKLASLEEMHSQFSPWQAKVNGLWDRVAVLETLKSNENPGLAVPRPSQPLYSLPDGAESNIDLGAGTKPLQSISKCLFDIDVLVDEPTAEFAGQVQPRVASQGKPQTSQPLGDENQEHIHTHATLETSRLPDRIRINALPILRGLEQVMESPLARGGPLVFVKPYKALNCFRREILSWYLNLKAREVAEAGRSEQATVHTEKPALSRTSSRSSNSTSDSHAVRSDDTPTRGENLESRESLEPRGMLEHMQSLISFMEEILEPYVQRMRSPGCQKVSFADIWHVFRPGDEVYHHTRQQAYRVMYVDHAGHRPVSNPSRRSKTDKDSVAIACIHIDFDGRSLGPVSNEFWIAHFDGLRSLNSLPVYPLRGEPRLHERLAARGVEFFQCTEISHLHYRGPTLDNRDEIDSQVVVDFEEAYSEL
ncbi:hypothetical protein PG994_002831 [Apiospora phragmitis]|uniref:DUF7025 domain-containing protein n=1 Tax=Apiospora phragmitis TaxID=2905665 RepID=A0ABR1WA16_9PEZI